MPRPLMQPLPSVATGPRQVAADSLFMCFDGRFDPRYVLLAVKSSGIFTIKASKYCPDVVHAKLYCQPSAAL